MTRHHLKRPVCWDVVSRPVTVQLQKPLESVRYKNIRCDPTLTRGDKRNRMLQCSVSAVLVYRSFKVVVPKSARGSSQLIQIHQSQNGPRSSARVSVLWSTFLTTNDLLLIADFVNPKDLPEGKTIVDYLVGETDGGLDFTFDATGNVRQGFEMVE